MMSLGKGLRRALASAARALLLGLLAACASKPPPPPPVQESVTQRQVAPVALPSAGQIEDQQPLAAPILQARSRWTAVRWADLPGWQDDALHEAWNAWLKSCERPGPVFAPLCAQVRTLSIADADQQRAWLMARLQPYQVEAMDGTTEGLLTAYFEPVLQASRRASAQFSIPLYQPPVGLAQRKPWYTRQEIDTSAQAQAALRGREIAFLADPIDALILQIQGSGRLRVSQADGTPVTLRLSYAGSNEHPYKSVGRWLIDQGALRDASWPSIKAWLQRNPERVNELLWSNPRVVFFREQRLSEQEGVWGPTGAQGVALTPGRSIAVDPSSIPYGTPVWLASSGPAVRLQKLVLAQDAGSAITGAVRADYFAGSGDAAAELAGRLKQPLRLWVLWPKSR